MGKNVKGNLRAVPPQFTTQAAQLTITAYTDRPPTFECTADIPGALRLLAAGIAIVSNAVEQASKPPAKAEADQADKKREFLGPREG